MKTFSGICPKCSKSLRFLDRVDFIICIHCKAKSWKSVKLVDEKEFQNLLALAKIEEASENFEVAYDLFSKALILNYSSYEAWEGKGYTAGMQSKLSKNRLRETIVCYEQSINFIEKNSEISKKIELAKAAFYIANHYFNYSLSYLYKFSDFNQEQFEHKERCLSIISLCEYALSLDNNLQEAKKFINYVKFHPSINNIENLNLTNLKSNKFYCVSDYCNKPLFDTVKYCPYCGFQLQIETEKTNLALNNSDNLTIIQVIDHEINLNNDNIILNNNKLKFHGENKDNKKDIYVDFCKVILYFSFMILAIYNLFEYWTNSFILNLFLIIFEIIFLMFLYFLVKEKLIKMSQ